MPPPPPAGGKPIGWDDPAQCGKLRAEYATPTPDEPEDESACSAGDELITSGDRVQSEAPILFAWVGWLVKAAGHGVNAICRLTGRRSDDAKAQVIDRTAPEVKAASDAFGLLWVCQFLGRWVGSPLDYLATHVRYKLQWGAPQYLPPQAEIDESYLLNRITDSQWECWTRAHGNMPNSHRMSRDNKQARLNVQEIIDLYQRKALTPAQLRHELRLRGVTDEAEIQRWVKLREQYPTFSDIVRMMVREATTPSVIDRDGLHEGFTDAYTPQLRAWAETAGITEDVAKALWAAHWVEISPTQAYGMYHRLRPGRVADALVFDKERLRKVLKEADYPPGLIEHLIAIAFLPINRTDLLTGIKNGTLDKPELIERLRDLGYSHEPVVGGGPTDAERLADIMFDQAARQLINATGQWTPRKIATEYRKGAIRRDVAADLLGRFLKTPEQIESVLTDSETLMKAERVAACVKGIHRRFLVGEFDKDECLLLLGTVGVDPTPAEELASKWLCERTSRRREPTVMMLRAWAENGIITAENLLARVKRLGYSEDDAVRIVQSAALDFARRGRGRAG